ncbi:MAG: FtsW/RodA/SpoVE family cell cycle protein [Oscillospiraceae bacterium]|nr:FtsW/RodA/SpoVE family cell cycle protein [Oscillospiraceae bacterium]
MQYLVETLLFFARILLPLVSFIIVFRSFRSLRNSRREKVPLISLYNKILRKSVPVMFWENSIGRSKSSDIILQDPTVSRDHAVIFRREKGWLVADTGSRLGVLVNGEKIKEPTSLYLDDVVTIGGNTLTVKRKESFGDGFDNSSLSADSVKRKKRKFSQKSLLFFVNIFHLILAFEIYLSGFRKTKGHEIVRDFKDIFDSEKFLWCLSSFFVVFVMSWFFFLITVIFTKRQNFELESIGIFLSGIGILLVGAEGIEQVYTQIASFAIGFFVFYFLIWLIKDLERAVKLRLAIGLVAVFLFIINLVFAKEYNGAKNWIFLGPISLQPSELIKIAFVFVGASTLDKLQTAKNLSAFIAFSAFCIACLFLMRDFGSACVFFVAFLIASFMRSGSIRTIILSCSAAAMGAFIVLKFKPYVAERFSVWRHVFEHAQEAGYQQSRALSYSASGGLFGVGAGNGALKNIFAGTSDLMFPVVIEELGLLVAIFVAITFGMIALFARSCSERSRSTFYSIASCTAGAIIAFQACLHIFGSTDILPLTGVTLPFLSLGGSSLVSVWGRAAGVYKGVGRQDLSFKK